MIEITGLKATSDQTLSIASPNGDGTINLRLHFLPRVQSWYIDIEFGTFVLNAFRISVCPNILHQYKNRISFGLLVASKTGLDPFLLNDFSSGNATLYLLTSAEVAQIEELITSGELIG